MGKMEYDDLEWSEWKKHNADAACRRSHTAHSAVVLERRAVLNSRMELSEAIRSHGERHTGLVAIVATGHGGKLHTGPEVGYCDTMEDAKALMSATLRQVFDGSWTPHAGRTAGATWKMMYSRWRRLGGGR